MSSSSSSSSSSPSPISSSSSSSSSSSPGAENPDKYHIISAILSRSTGHSYQLRDVVCASAASPFSKSFASAPTPARTPQSHSVEAAVASKGRCRPRRTHLRRARGGPRTAGCPVFEPRVFNRTHSIGFVS